VKEHIRDLQHRIKATVLLDAGKVRDLAFLTRSSRVHATFQLSIAGIVESIQSLFVGKSKKEKFTLADSLYANGASIDRTTNNVLSLLIGASVELSQCQYAALVKILD
jgi:hypothetical protein